MPLAAAIHFAEEFWEIMGIILCLIIFYFIWIYLPAKMARNRGRSELGWILLTWLLTPIWSCVLLLIVGDRED